MGVGLQEWDISFVSSSMRERSQVPIVKVLQGLFLLAVRSRQVLGTEKNGGRCKRDEEDNKGRLTAILRAYIRTEGRICAWTEVVMLISF